MNTEEKARELWCPFTRVGEQASGAAENRPDGSYNCIASKCMAWRWDVVLNDQLLADARASYSELQDPAPLRKDSPIYTDFLKSRHGYCGLAGKPE